MTCIARLTQMAPWLASRLSEKREREAAQPFFKDALAVVGQTPERVTTGGHASYPRAVRETLGDQVLQGASNGLLPGMVSGALTQQFVSVVLLTNYATISDLAPLWENRPHAHHSDALSLIGLQP